MSAVPDVPDAPQAPDASQVTPAMPEATPAAPAAQAPVTGRSNFTRSTAGVFGTRVAQFTLGIAATFVAARLLGEAGRGEYQLVMLFPTMLFAVAQFGLPSAITFFSGRGRAMTDLRRGAVLMTVGFSILLIAFSFAVLPFLETNALKAASPTLLEVVLFAIPLQFANSLTGGILYGRHAFRHYNFILLGQSVASLVLVIAFVGVAGMGVLGAILAYLITQAGAAAAVAFQVSRIPADDLGPNQPRVHLRELLGYGFKLYPSSVTSFFSYRADVFLLGWLNGSAAQIGLYGFAVNIAELLFNVPDSIATVLYPTIAGTDRADADRRTPQVARFTMLVTVLAAIAIVPTSYVAIRLLVPSFIGSMPALIVILPGIVSLSLSKILASYISGLGRPVPVTIAASIALTINLVANLILIPRFGIVGASASSLISYTCHAVMMLTFSSRMAHTSPLDFIIPRGAEVRRLVAAIRSFGRQLLDELRERRRAA